MATLTGRTPGDTYKNLLQIDNSNSGVDVTLRRVEDGEGDNTALSLGTTSAQIHGSLEADSMTIGGVGVNAGVATTLSNAAAQDLGTASAGSNALAARDDHVHNITTVVSDTTPQLCGDLDCNGAQIQWSKGADVASATALPVLTDGNYFDITGTTTVTSINTTGGAGTLIKLHFDAALTLTHHSANLVLPGASNITTAAGDEFEFLEYGSGTYRCTSYALASGKAIVGQTGAFTDSDHIVQGSADSSKTMRIEVDGLTSSAERVLTMPDKNLTPAEAGANSDITSLTGLTTDLTVAQGGSGAGTFTDGGILLGSGTGAFTAMAVLANGAIAIGDGTTDPVPYTAFSSSTGTLNVSSGGTGAATLTDGGVLLGSGTGAVTAMAVLGDGSIIVGDGSTDPVALAAFSSSTGNLVGAKGGTIGQQTIWVPAGAMEAAVTTAAATSNAVEIGTSLFAARTMDFATGADDFCYASVQMPKSWNAGTLFIQFVWSATGTTANTVLWGIAATSLSDNDVLTTAFATPTSPAADTNSTTADDLMISAEVEVTVGNTPAAEELVIFEISRDVSGDTLAEDARLHGIRIHYTVNTGIDT